MSRRALLISSSDVTGSKKLKGADVDVDILQSFLKSKIGGAWNNTEISILTNPDTPEVISAVMDFKPHQYAFIACSGHGRHPNNSDPLETEILLQDGYFPVKSLQPTSLRSTIIIDVCRDIVTFPERTKTFITEHTKIATKLPDRAIYRQLFESYNSKRSQSSTYIFSCNINQKAAESSLEGGLFTRTMISKAIEWEELHNGYNSILSVSDAFQRTRFQMEQVTDQQPQIIQSPENAKSLAFAVYHS